MPDDTSVTKPAARFSRRDFLKAAALAAATPALAPVLASASGSAAGPAASAPAVVPSRIFARPAPSDTMLFGCIGTGRQGMADMQELVYRGLESGARVAAVCDVDSHRRENAQWTAEKIYAQELGLGKYEGIAAYHDFREVRPAGTSTGSSSCRPTTGTGSWASRRPPRARTSTWKSP